MASNVPPISDGDGTYICHLTPELLKKAEQELREKPEWRSRDIQALRDMVESHPGVLKGLRCSTTDEFLLRFLRARKFDYDRAFQLVVTYFQIRAENSTVFTDLVPSSLEHIWDAGISLILPHRDKHGRRILYFRPGLWNPAEFPIYDLLKANVINMEIVVKEEETQINGIIAIGDFTGISLNQVKRFERSYAKLVTSVIQEAFPLRFKGMHAVNEPAVISYVFPVLKPFIKEKLSTRLHFYGSNLRKLHRELSPDILPEELGGYLGPVSELAKSWREKVREYENHFVEMQQWCLNGPNLTMQAHHEEAVECLLGAYRKMNVD